ncbi:biosynthetic-type acetolactate synthase large subunit [Bacillus salitolerans]|uniref:Acetolactate synthase n=1 Tax=Bacillus salitolerans TaxID=1437434 RepID=A0ABW4LRJ0_9BACI
MKTLEEKTSQILSGSKMLVEALKEENVEVVFGYPGGAVLNIYDALFDGGIPHILPRHEQGAIHAAEGYARISGKPGVVIATSGPGATNIMTGLADAMMDSLPLVVFTGQVNDFALGSDAFQEAPILGMSTPVTKHNYQVRDVKDLPRTIKEAFYIATTGRPGPVLIDIPKNISAAACLFHYPEHVHLPGYQVVSNPDKSALTTLVEAIHSSKKPIILAGAGILLSKANGELLTFVQKTKIPVVNTLLGLGSFPASHSLFLGMGGMHGTYAANMGLYECDLLINIGARFDDRLTGNIEHFAKFSTVVHIDIDPAEIGKNVFTHIPIVGDAKETLHLLNEESYTSTFLEWHDYLSELMREFPLWYEDDLHSFKPQRLIESIHACTNGNAVITTDVGQHQMWAAQFYGFDSPNKWVTSGGLGTMGFGLPAAIGAQIAQPNELVIAILGDAGFQMTMQELALLTHYKLPIKVVIVNNQSMGMVRQWQEIFYDGRYSHSLLPDQPDYVKLASAFGLKGVVIQSEDSFIHNLKAAIDLNEPIILDCRITKTENVYPMVSPGKGIHEMVGVKP